MEHVNLIACGEQGPDRISLSQLDITPILVHWRNGAGLARFQGLPA